MNDTEISKEELIAELELLKAYKKNMSFVLDNIKEMFYKLNFDEKGNKTFEFISPQIIDVLGLTVEEYIKNQSTLSEYFHSDDLEKIIKEVAIAKKSNKIKTIQYRFFNKKLNKYVWIEETFTPSYSAENKLVSILGSAKNISEKKENQNQKDFILENIEEVIYNVKFDTVNKSKELVFVSPQIINLTGLTPEEFVKEGLSGILIKRIHPEDVEEIKKNIRKLYDDKKNRIHSQFRFKPKGKKEYLWLDETLNAKYNKNGNLIETITVLRDITESKQLSDKIKLSEKSYRNLLNNSPDLIYIINEKAQFIDVNTTVVKKLGYSKKELIGKTPAIFSDSTLNDLSTIRTITQKALKKTQYFDWWKKNKKGKLFLMEIILRKGIYLGKEVIIASARDITERIETQNKIKTNEEKLSLVLENIKEGIYSIDFKNPKERNFSYANNQLKKVFGKNFEDFATMSWAEKIKYYHPDDIPKIEKASKELFVNQKKSFLVEYRFKKYNEKEYSWLEEKIFPKFDKEGKLLTNFGIVRDITQQKLAEIHLKEKEELYRNLFTKNLAGVFITENGIIIECNNSFAKYFGYKSRIELIGKKAEILYFDKKDRDVYIKELQKTSYLTNYKLKNKKKDGSEVWILTNVSLTNKEKNRVEGTLIEITEQVKKEEFEKEKLRLQLVEESNKLLQKEINERKIIEQQLVENQKYTRGIIDSSLDIICASDIKGNIIEYNKAAQKAFGYSSKEIQKKTIQSIYANKREFLAVSKQLKTKGVFVGEVINRRKNGEIFTSFLSASVLKNKKGEIIGTMGVSRDITQEKIAEQQLIESEEKYRDLFENASDLIQSVDSFGNIIYVNNAWKKALGFSEIEIKKLNIFDIIYPEDKKHCQELFGLLMKSKSEIRVRTTFSFLTKGKRKLTVEGDISCKIINKKTISTRAIFRDVTEENRRKTQQNVYNNIAKSFTEKTQPNELYETIRLELGKIIDTTIFGISYKKDKETIEFLYFYDITRGGEIIIPPRKNKNGFNEYLIKNKKSGIFYKNDLLKLEKEKKIELFGPSCEVLVAVPLKIKNDVIGFVTIQSYTDKNAFDIKTIEILEFFAGSIALVVQRKYDEQKIYEQSARLKSIIEIDTHMFWTYNKHKGITSFNKKFADEIYKLYGKKPQTENEKKELNIIIKTDDDQPIWDEKYKKVFDGAVQQFVLHKTLKNGERIIKEVVLNPIFNKDGTVTDISGISHDVTAKTIAEEQIIKQSAKLKSIIENSTHLFWTFHKEQGLTSFNQNYYNAFVESYGFPPKINQNKLFKEDKRFDNFWKEKYSLVFKGKKIEFTTERVNKKGILSIKEVFLSPIFNLDGTVSEVSGMAHDITEKKIAETELKSSLKEKEVLLKEVHHRVKNNLQVISSILNLQSSYVQDEKTLTILKESQNRIKSMAFIHESLYQTNDFSQINFSEYVVNLSKNLVHSYLVNQELIELKLDINNVSLNLDLSIPCGLIINELVSNALKYAFGEGKKGYILIQLFVKDEFVYLSISDNGKGFPKEIDYRNTDSLGLQLVTTLAEQINAEITLNNTKGTTFNIKFKQHQ